MPRRMSATTENRERLYEQFVAQPENTLTVQFEREEEPGVSFSPETYEQLNDIFLAFLAARSQRWFAENPGKGMTQLQVRFQAEIE